MSVHFLWVPDQLTRRVRRFTLTQVTLELIFIFIPEVLLAFVCARSKYILLYQASIKRVVVRAPLRPSPLTLLIVDLKV